MQADAEDDGVSVVRGLPARTGIEPEEHEPDLNALGIEGVQPDFLADGEAGHSTSEVRNQRAAFRRAACNTLAADSGQAERPLNNRTVRADERSGTAAKIL